jgi:hypothetical protein
MSALAGKHVSDAVAVDSDSLWSRLATVQNELHHLQEFLAASDSCSEGGGIDAVGVLALCGLSKEGEIGAGAVSFLVCLVVLSSLPPWRSCWSVLEHIKVGLGVEVE